MVYHKKDNRANVHPKKKEYYPKLKNLISTLGPAGVNYYQLEKEWQIADTTLHTWGKEICKEIGPLKALEVGANNIHNMDWHCKLLHRKIVECTDIKVSAYLMEIHSRIVERLMRTQEGYGFKPVVSNIGNTSNDDLVLSEKAKNVFGSNLLEDKHEKTVEGTVQSIDKDESSV